MAPLSTYHVTATAGAHRLYFGDDLATGQPIMYAGLVPSGTTVFYDPHVQGTAHLFFVHAMSATGSSIGPTGNTEISPGTGLSSRLPGTPGNYGKQTAWSSTGSDNPTQESE